MHADNIKVKGATLGLQALPHREFWLEIAALTTDGLAFTVVKVKQVAAAAPAHAGGSEPTTGTTDRNSTASGGDGLDEQLITDVPLAPATAASPSAEGGSSDDSDSDLVE